MFIHGFYCETHEQAWDLHKACVAQVKKYYVGTRERLFWLRWAHDFLKVSTSLLLSECE